LQCLHESPWLGDPWAELDACSNVPNRAEGIEGADPSILPKPSTHHVENGGLSNDSMDNADGDDPAAADNEDDVGWELISPSNDPGAAPGVGSDGIVLMHFVS